MSWSATVVKLFISCVVTQWSTSMATDEINNQRGDGQNIRLDAGNRARQLRGDLSRTSSEFSSSNRHNAGQMTRSSDFGTTNIATQLERESARTNHLSSESAQLNLPEMDEIMVCSQMTVDFAKAANGRGMWGGEFVRDDWFHHFGFSIDAEGHDGKSNLHPMIFDSAHVESNGLGGIFALGSPNFDCEGFGVGTGGKIGQAGENCNELGNILIPSRKPGFSSSTSTSPPGGVLVFEFYKHTRVENIGFLNIGSSDQIMVVFTDGSLERINLSSVGQNGFQNIKLDMDRVKKIHVSLHSFGAVTGLDLCVADH